MARRPSDKFLRSYYEQWRKGHGSVVIAKALLVKVAYLKTHVAYLHEYCRKRLAKETREDLTTGTRLQQLELTPEWREQLVRHVEDGLTLEETAGVLGVPLPTITQLWFHDDPGLRVECGYARQRADVEVMAAVRRRAVGYTLDHVEETETATEGVLTTKVMRTHKHVPAHPASQRLWLVNRRGWVADNRDPPPEEEKQEEYDLSKLSEDELRKMVKYLEQASVEGNGNGET